MCHTILVPLDGSPHAEEALPLAFHIASRSGMAIRLLHVHVMYLFKEPGGAWCPYNQEDDMRYERQELAYLESVARIMSDGGVLIVDIRKGTEGLAELQRQFPRSTDIVDEGETHIVVKSVKA